MRPFTGKTRFLSASIVGAGLTAAGSDATARALALGAVDCYCKSDFSGAAMQDDGRLARMVRP